MWGVSVPVLYQRKPFIGRRARPEGGGDTGRLESVAVCVSLPCGRQKQTITSVFPEPLSQMLWEIVLQWNLSNTDNLGPIKCVRIREVSSFQGVNSTHLYEVGTWSSVLSKEVSLIQSWA